MHDITLDEIRVVIGLMIYREVFEFSHEHLESLYKMDGTGNLIFSADMEKNRLQFLLSMMRFDDKATRAKRRFNDKLRLFRKVWDVFVETCNSMYLVGGSFCIDEQLLPFRGKYSF